MSRLQGRAPGQVSDLGSGLAFLFGHAEVPVEQQVLALGVPHDPLAVAAELRIVGRQQLEAGEHAGPELLDERAVPEVRVDLPMGRHRAEVHHADVPTRRFVRGFLGDRHRAGDRTRQSVVDPNVARTICCSPSRSIVISIRSPGWWLRTAERTSSELLTESPSISMITSPSWRPAPSAAESGWIVSTKAPWSTVTPN